MVRNIPRIAPGAGHAQHDKHHREYGERFSLGLLTASGSLGLILVPSMPLILYGVVAQQFHTTPPVSIDALFKAGILPCALMVGLLAIYSVWHARRAGVVRAKTSGRELGAAMLDAAWEIPLPFVILGGIYSGKLAASEAAAATALYVLIVTVLISFVLFLLRRERTA